MSPLQTGAHTPPRTTPWKAIHTKLTKIDAALNRIGNRPTITESDIPGFIERLKIVDKHGKLVPLFINPAQEIVLEKLLDRRAARQSGRFICCKSRQMGISTLIEAFIFALLVMNPNRRALVAAHCLESAHGIFSTTKRFFRDYAMKSSSKPLLNSRRFQFPPPHNSLMVIDTANNKNLGRGSTFQYVHASETAFWENADVPMLSIAQAVPQHWDSLLFIESTANGIGNHFHQMWRAAESGDSDFEPIFLSWKTFPEYSFPTTHSETIEIPDEEAAFADRHALSPEQTEWLRFTKRNQCGNSWDKFHQEYPISADLAFTFSGTPWFDPQALRSALEEARAPAQRGLLRFDGTGSPEFVDVPRGPLAVWKVPEPNLSYSLGMDVGEGLGADYTVIQVICNETREVVAAFSSNKIKAEESGIDAYLLAAWYNYGLLGIERNGPGLAVLTVCERGSADFPFMQPYPNLYYHTILDRKTPLETRKLGWLTTRLSKETMLVRLREIIIPGGLVVHSKRTLLEMLGFMWDSENRRFVQNYKIPGSKMTHDDEIMALAIANEMRLHQLNTAFLPGGIRHGDF